MRILWFTNNPSLFTTLFFGGAWMSSLEKIVSKHDGIQLGVAFEYDKPVPKEQRENTTYYPIYEKRSRLRERYIDSYTYHYHDKFLLDEGIKIIEDFKPDVIHVWGSEWCFGLLKEMTDVPMVIHIQGCWNVNNYVNNNISASRTLWDYIHETWRPQLWWSFLRKRHLNKERAIREEKILSINRYFLGRTRWDKALTKMFSPESKYYFCSEMLREDFTKNATRWTLPESEKCTLITVANSDMAKGFDIIFKTADILKRHAGFPFEWKVIGNGADSLFLAERKTGIKAADVNITAFGQKPGSFIMEHLTTASMFVHTSYVDNSPNAVCEAQYVGLPVIATNVGGVPSLFAEDYDQDMFVPLHDPYYLASKIIELFRDKTRMQRLSDSNFEIAHSRHNSVSIEHDLFECYDDITKTKTKKQ